MDPFEGSLNYAQQHQQHTRQVLRDRVLSNIEESPRRRTPIANPHTPTPLPGSAEQARANARSTSRISREVDLQSSPRQRHLSCVQDDENRAPTANGSATSVMEQICSMYPILADIISLHSHHPLHSSATVLMYNEKNRRKTDKG
jgi:hypothetical protein